MKRILYLTCIGSLALAVTAWGEEIKGATSVRGKARAARGASTAQTATRHGAMVRSAGQMRTRSNVSPTRFRQNAYTTTPRSSSITTRDNLRNTRARTFRERNVTTNNQVRARDRVTLNRQRNFNTNRERNVVVNRERNVTVNNNWRGSNFSGQRYAAFRNYHREWHSRDWWRHNHSRIVFVFGSPYYWDTGYWYPAWGYYPTAYYPYDGPIYGGNADLTPDQVTVEVQQQLQRDGYYAGPIDGVLGPMTRQAIAAFQADHGLAITSAIDEPTLNTLGLS